MAYNDKITTSIHGRRFGLQTVSTGVSGSGVTGRLFDLLCGPEAVRQTVSTADTTSANIAAYGVSRLTTAVSSGVYTLDPPIPGVVKTLVFDTTGTNPIYVKTANAEYISSTQATTNSVISSSQTAPYALQLVGVSTSQYYILGALSSGNIKLGIST